MKSRVLIGVGLAALQTVCELIAQHMQAWAARNRKPTMQAAFSAVQIATNSIELLAFQYAPLSVVTGVGVFGLVANLATETGLTRLRVITTLTVAAAAGVGVILGAEASSGEADLPAAAPVPHSALVMLLGIAVCYALVLQRARRLPKTKNKQKAVLYGAAIAMAITSSSWAGTALGNLARRGSSSWEAFKTHWFAAIFLILVTVGSTASQQLAYLFVHGVLDMHITLCAVETFSMTFSYIPSLLVLNQMQTITWPLGVGIAAAHAVQLFALAAMTLDA
jgi:hypothetical protein